MITFKASVRSAKATTDDAITTQSVGIPVRLCLDPEFNGLAKTFCAKNGAVSVDVALVGDATETVIPPDVLQTTGQLQIGVYAADENGDIVIPTVWALAGIVRPGVVPSGVDPAEPTPSWVAQVQNIASEALATANSVREDADAGEFDGATGPQGPQGETGPQGPKGDPGEVTEAELTSAISEKAGILRDSATGAIASFVPDYTVENLLGLSVAVEPVQSGSGDPSPDNVRPITGWDSVAVNRTGKNLLDISLANRTLVTTGANNNTSPRAFDKPYLYVGITMNNYFRNENIVSYSVGEKTVVVNTRQTAYGLGYTVPVKPGTAYTLSYKNKAISTMGIGYYDADGNYLGFNNINIGTAWTFSTPTNCHNITVVFRPEQGSDFTYEEPQLELGSTATAYEPYSGNTYTIQLGETVYGGTLDVVNGKMTVTHQLKNLKTWNDARIVSYDYTSTRGTFHGAYFQYALDQNVSRIPGLCNMAYVSQTNDPGVGYSHWMWFGVNSAIIFWIGILDVLGMTIEQFRTWVHENDIQVYIPLATPFELTLTPEQIATLQGTNNVWSDAGNVTVDFAADLKTYIDNKIAAAVAALS